mgnify:FL=1
MNTIIYWIFDILFDLMIIGLIGQYCYSKYTSWKRRKRSEESRRQ